MEGEENYNPNTAQPNGDGNQQGEKRPREDDTETLNKKPRLDGPDNILDAPPAGQSPFLGIPSKAQIPELDGNDTKSEKPDVNNNNGGLPSNHPDNPIPMNNNSPFPGIGKTEQAQDSNPIPSDDQLGRSGIPGMPGMPPPGGIPGMSNVPNGNNGPNGPTGNNRSNIPGMGGIPGMPGGMPGMPGGPGGMPGMPGGMPGQQGRPGGPGGMPGQPGGPGGMPGGPGGMPGQPGGPSNSPDGQNQPPLGPNEEKVVIFFRNKVYPLKHVRFDTLPEFQDQLSSFLEIPPGAQLILINDHTGTQITNIHEKRQAENIRVDCPNLNMGPMPGNMPPGMGRFPGGMPPGMGIPPGMPGGPGMAYPNYAGYPGMPGGMPPGMPGGPGGPGGYYGPKSGMMPGMGRNDQEILNALERNDQDIMAKLPPSKTPVMDAFVFCALCNKGVTIAREGQGTLFSINDYDDYWNNSRIVCSKRSPTKAEVSRLKSLRRWFMDFPGFKELKAVKKGSPPVIVRVQDERTDKITAMIKKMRQVLSTRIKRLNEPHQQIH
eukprot:TRINITY_DN81_c0_g1_i1.p1 TRINITY_DN81_c0_g1~~TRINITY_DN81_c0_g1_i1.p1  ORF type:complete len:545 (-),score=179.63 TRINITY_DN81_c0_g1_i1:52-1686(-)